MKQCNAPNCSNSVFSNGYCKAHGYLRTDEKWLKNKTRGIGFTSLSLMKPRKATGEGILFKMLFTTRKHISFISELPIDNIDHSNCAHVLAKGQNKYPKFKLLDKNIVFLTKEEHHIYDNGTEEQRIKYQEEKAKEGVIVNWKKLYDLRDELKKEYF